jgi:hypothetical protein
MEQEVKTPQVKKRARKSPNINNSKFANLSISDLIARSSELIAELEDIKLELGKAVEAFKEIGITVGGGGGGTLNQAVPTNPYYSGSLNPSIEPTQLALPEGSPKDLGNNMEYSFKVMAPEDSVEDIKGVIAEQVKALESITNTIKV